MSDGGAIAAVISGVILAVKGPYERWPCYRRGNGVILAVAVSLDRCHCIRRGYGCIPAVVGELERCLCNSWPDRGRGLAAMRAAAWLS